MPPDVTPPLAVAVDIGGTFTDVMLQDAAGRRWRAKTPSRPDAPADAFIEGMRLALDDAGGAAAQVGRVLHGTTVATNMMLEGKGARTALLTTAGFRHVLEIGRQDIPRRSNLYAWVKPARPVPPERVLELRERVAPGGAVLEPLVEADVHAAAGRLRAMGVEAVAICLLHSYANPAHEQRAAELLRELLPGVAVSASVDVLPVAREFERSLAAVLNAAVMPGVSRYVARLEERLGEAGVRAPLLLMGSNGGVAGAATMRRAPALTALSGPAAGVVGAREVAAACGVGDLITVDIGGTSADICLLRGGEVGLTTQGRIGEWPLPLPMLDMVTIGAGGGSLARVRDGALTVGPESAGAQPGPACYGRGGTQATVTDAHVVLGHLPTRLLGGRMRLDAEAAARAVHDGVAAPLGLSLLEAARGVLAIADSTMVGAIRVLSVERGHDPRDFALVPFGGAGPLHGCALAELLGVRRVLVPPAPGVLCAEGLLAADLRAGFSRTLPRPGAPDAADAEPVFAALEREATAWLAAEAVPPEARTLGRVALLRFRGQGSELAVPWTGADTARGFAEAHRALYGFALDAPVELVTLRVEAVGRLPAVPRAELPPGTGARAREWWPVHLPGGTREVPILERDSLGAGDRVEGPAILVQLDATTLVAPGWGGVVAPSGAVLLEREG